MTGLAWPAARVVSSTPMVFKAYPHNLDRKPPARTIFTLGASGTWLVLVCDTPTRLLARTPEQLDPADAEAVTAFVCRRGDPDGLIDASTETHTSYWYTFEHRARDPPRRHGSQRMPPGSAASLPIRHRLHGANSFLALHPRLSGSQRILSGAGPGRPWLCLSRTHAGRFHGGISRQRA